MVLFLGKPCAFIHEHSYKTTRSQNSEVPIIQHFAKRPCKKSNEALQGEKAKLPHVAAGASLNRGRHQHAHDGRNAIADKVVL